MNQNYDLRPALTSNLVDAIVTNDSIGEQWPLFAIPKNKLAYKLYYYMLSKSAYDHRQKHAFISDRMWVKKEAAQALHCDPRSISNNLKTLLEKKILERDDLRKAYIFTRQSYEAPINYELVSSILDLDGLLDSVEALRVLSVITYAYNHQITAFCATDIKYALGKPEFNADFIRILLVWWRSLGIIDYSEHRINKGFCTHVKYQLHYVNTAREIEKTDDGILSPEFKELFSQVKF